MKTKFTFWTTALLFSFLFSNTSMATHLIGGEITWECNSTNGQYRITSKLYRDCDSSGVVNIPMTLMPISVTGSATINANLLTIYQVNPDCYDPTLGYSCGMNNGAYEVHVFKSAWVTIANIPTSGLELSWGSCCRTALVTNLSTTSFSLRAKMYPTLGGGTSCNNNSPTFLEEPLVRACMGVQTVFNPIATDIDNDSIFVKLAFPIDQVGANALYNTGYSSLNPFPDAAKNSLNIPLSVNSSNGAMSFKSYTNGLFINVYEIQEWRQGVLIGRVFRDAVTIIAPCTTPLGVCPQTTDFPPTLDIVSVVNSPNIDTVITAGLLEYEVNVSIGDTIKANINSYDFDFNPNCNPQQIAFAATGLHLSLDTAYGNPYMCSQIGPCASITSQNAGGGFINPASNQVSFQWEVTSAHLSYQGLQTQKATHVFNFSVTDDNCPLPKSTQATLKVNIEDNTPGPPSLSQSCVNIVASSGDINFSATQSIDTADSFLGYYVYHSTNKAGPYSVIDTISNYALSGYTDVGRGPGANHYFMRTASTMLSPTSDTLSLMNLNIQPSGSNPPIITLYWNAHSSNQNANVHYQVWKRQNFSSSWLLIDSTQALTYVDTPSAIVTGLDYKIAIGGTCFSSKTNTIGLEEENVLESITVSPVPFDHELTVTLPEGMSGNQVAFELYNIAGKRITVESERLNTSEIKLIGLMDLPKGVYILNVSAKNKTKTFKLIH